MPSINLDNLERYDSKARNEAEEEYMPKDSGNWQKTEEAGAVAFYPVPNTPLEGKVKFSFKETPPASGDKSPSNPSTITGVESATLTKFGKNLCPNTVISTIGGTVEITNNSDGSLTFNGTPTNNYYAYVYNISTPNTKMWAPWLKKGGTYTFSMSGDSGGVHFEMYHTKDTGTFGGFSVYIDPGESATYTFPTDRTGLILRYKINAGTTVSNCTVKVQIEEGPTATVFEPYNATDCTINLGNTYYGGEIDLATGVMTVTWVGKVFDGTEPFRIVGVSSGLTRFVYDLTVYNLPIAAGGENNSICSHAVFLGSTDGVWGNFNITTTGTSSYFYMQDKNEVIATLDNYIAWVASQYSASTPLTIAYKIATPYTVQLTPTEILSLAQTDKCMPRLNTVYTDADTIQIGYMKSPQRTEQEITQALLELESD